MVFYLNSILATTEAKEKGFDEALLLDSDGFLAEGPGANLFFEKDGKYIVVLFFLIELIFAIKE